MALGFNEGFNAARNARLVRDRTAVGQGRLDLELRQQQIEEKNATVRQAQEQIIQTLDVARTLWAQALTTGRDRTKAVTAVNEFARSARSVARAAGLDPRLIDGQVAAILGMQTPQEATEQEAIKASMKKLAEQRATEAAKTEGLIARSRAAAKEVGPEDARSVRLAQLGVPQGSQPEFLRLLNELDNAVTGSPRAKRIEKRLDKLSSEGGFGFDIQVDESGNIRRIGFGQGASASTSIPALTGKAVDDLRADAETIDIGLQVADRVLESLDQNPERYGLAGTVVSGVENVAGITKDLASTTLESIPGVQGVRGVFDRLNDLVSGLDASDEVKEVLRPTTAGEVEVLEALLRVTLIRTMRPTGRLLKSDLEDIKDLTSFTGLRSSARVREKVIGIQQFLVSRRAGTQRRLEQGVTGQATTPAVPVTERTAPQGLVPTLSDDEVTGKVNKLFPGTKR